MLYIFWILGMLAFKWAIVDQCQCILWCVRILLAKLTLLTTTSETLSYRTPLEPGHYNKNKLVSKSWVDQGAACHNFSQFAFCNISWGFTSGGANWQLPYCLEVVTSGYLWPNHLLNLRFLFHHPRFFVVAIFTSALGIRFRETKKGQMKSGLGWLGRQNPHNPNLSHA